MRGLIVLIDVSVCILSVWLCVCCQGQKMNQAAAPRLYQKENSELNAKYMVYHLNDSVSQLYYDIDNDGLIYKKTDTSDFFYSHLRLQLCIKLEGYLDVFGDTISLAIRDRQSHPKQKAIVGNILFDLKKGSQYHITINVVDVNKRTAYFHDLFSDKSTISGRQNFLVTNSAQEVLFFPYYKPNDQIYLQSNRNTKTILTVDYFKTGVNIASPPFAIEPMPRFIYKPDSTYSVFAKGGKLELTLPASGFLHLRADEDTKEGVTCFVYETGYPKIKRADQMVLATRYIMAKKEFDHCQSAPDQKMAIDDFWMAIGGSKERAKELIKSYYGRVQEANQLFASYKEGWKTDRGMIYIVFGPPRKVTRYQHGETWTYGEIGSPASTVFSFLKLVNLFSDNDFYLERDEQFKAPWYQAVDMWRQGRVYLDR